MTVNGAQASLGTPVGPADRVCLDGRAVGGEEEHVYLALNKPIGIDCSTDRRVPDNILDFVDHRLRIFPVGRLDKDSQGLILLTNDGDIVNELLRVEHGHEKEYRVTVDKPVTDEFLAALARGVRILGTRTRPARTERIDAHAFRIVLTQGLNRQIRRMCAVFGYRVLRLERTRIVNITLTGLALGRWRDLTGSELAGLLPERFGR